MTLLKWMVGVVIAMQLGTFWMNWHVVGQLASIDARLAAVEARLSSVEGRLTQADRGQGTDSQLSVLTKLLQ